MTRETSEDDDAALARLAALGDGPADGPEQEVFLAISAAMVAHGMRNHPALVQGDRT